MGDRPTWTTTSISVVPGADLVDATPGLVLVYSPYHARLPSVFGLHEGSTLLGRDPDNRIAFPDAAVSRVHAEILRDGDSCWIADRRSTNGTLVNGRRVEQARLHDHDVVRVGDNVLRFAARAAYDHAPYRIDDASPSPRRAEAAARGLVGGLSLSRALERLDKVAPTDLAVIVGGESGTGKELVARELHARSGRRGPFVPVNCGAIVAQLGESELFGHKRGAFTGATADKLGYVRTAHGGTLFLDEIGEMPPELQVKLLRVLQERQVVPVGATAPVSVDLRVVAATHRDLERLVSEDRFRGDLLARLRDFVVELPPLRHRREDLYPLVRHVLRREGRDDLETSFAFMVALAHYDWPYNVRELERAVRHAVALVEPGESLEPRHLPETVRRPLAKHGRRPTGEAMASHRPPLPVRGPPEPQSGPSTARATPSRPERPSEDALRDALASHGGNVAAVARQFGKKRMQVHRWMSHYGIDPDTYRG